MKKIILLLLVCGSVFAITACSGKKESKIISVGLEWLVNETTELSALTIEEDATLLAPDGKDLTLTVDGVETPIEQGTYEGDVVVTVTDAIIVPYSGMGANLDYYYRTAVYVENGKYISSKSVEAAAVGGSVDDAQAEDIKVTSVGDIFGAFIVTGDEEFSYSIINPEINMTGNGVNDFNGYGASIRTNGSANVTVENAKINNTGVVRTAVWVGGNSTTNINNSEIEVHNGTMPEDYSWSWANGGPAGDGYVMMEVPWMLGIVGNNRATNVVENGNATYNNTHVVAQAWGALSTDAVQNTKLNAIGCHIETLESGYGSYCDGATNYFSNTVFDVKDYGLIITGGKAHFTDGCVVNSGRFGVMSHAGSGDITIDNGCVFNTKEACLQFKSGKPSVTVENCEMNSESGIILHVMVNDDPNNTASGGAPTALIDPDAPEGGAPAGGPEGMPQGGAPEGAPGGDMPEGGQPGGAPAAPTNEYVIANFKNMEMNGDMITSMTSLSDVVITLENVSLTGAISTTIGVHAKGANGEELVMQDDPVLHTIIGSETNTYCTTDDEYGMIVSIDGSSKWVVDKSSYLTGLKIASGADISAPAGYQVTMTVNGKSTPISAGNYEGKIVLKVTKG